MSFYWTILVMTNTYSGQYSNMVDDVTAYTPDFFSAALGNLQKWPLEGVGDCSPSPPPRGAALVVDTACLGCFRIIYTHPRGVFVACGASVGSGDNPME